MPLIISWKSREIVKILHCQILSFRNYLCWRAESKRHYCLLRRQLSVTINFVILDIAAQLERISLYRGPRQSRPFPVKRYFQSHNPATLSDLLASNQDTQAIWRSFSKQLRRALWKPVVLTTTFILVDFKNFRFTEIPPENGRPLYTNLDNFYLE